MKSKKSIFVTQYFSVNALHTREQAQRLIQEAEIALLHHEPVWFDFTGIDFMSRSFADEFLKLTAFWKLIKQSDWLGLSVSAKNMIEMVTAGRRANANKSVQIPSVIVTDKDILHRFFEAV